MVASISVICYKKAKCGETETENHENCGQVTTRNHSCVSAPCRISSIFSMSGHNKPRSSFNNLTSIQPAGAIQAVL